MASTAMVTAPNAVAIITINKVLKLVKDTRAPPATAPKPPKLKRIALFKLDESRKILSGK